jgi:hypothetical protein
MLSAWQLLYPRVANISIFQTPGNPLRSMPFEPTKGKTLQTTCPSIKHLRTQKNIFGW